MSTDIIARALARGATLTPTVAPSTGTGVKQILLEANPVGESILNEKGGNDSVATRITRSVTQTVQGGNTYYDTTQAFSINLDTSYQTVNPRLGGGRFAIESKFRSGAGLPLWSEFHIAGYSATQDEDGTALANGNTEMRLFTGYVPFKYSDWGMQSFVGHTAAKITFNDGYNTQLFQFNMARATVGTAAAGTLECYGSQIRQMTNNVQGFIQLNAAGNGTVSLPFVNNRNEIASNSTTYTIAAPANNVYGAAAVTTVLGNGTTAGQTVEYVSQNVGITGDFYARKALASNVSGKWISEHDNTMAGGVALQRIACSTTGVAALTFNGNGASFTWGLDATSTKFRLTNQDGAVSSATPVIEIDKTTLQASFGAPIVHKGYTVATLPAGVTGARAYVTDATAPTFLGTLTGGGSVVCPVFYNGSAWVSG
jgi:hypothetical protein